jgi:GAF domain-containing protein
MKLTKDFDQELRTINQMLGADFAIISHIRSNNYDVIAVASELEHVNIGDRFITENTYCNEVIDTRNTVTYEHVARIKAMILHPIYTAMQLEAYIGEPLWLNGEIVGTLNFSGFMPKDQGFSDSEIAAVKSLARQIEEAIDPASV